MGAAEGVPGAEVGLEAAAAAVAAAGAEPVDTELRDVWETEEDGNVVTEVSLPG